MSHTQTALTQEKPGWQQGRDELLHIGFWLSSSPAWKKSLLAGSRGPAGPGAATLAPWQAPRAHSLRWFTRTHLRAWHVYVRSSVTPSLGPRFHHKLFQEIVWSVTAFSTLNIPRHWAFPQNITCVRCLTCVCCLLMLCDTLQFIKWLLITLTQFSRGF